MSVSSQPEIDLSVTPNAGVEVKKFMDAEGVTAELGGLRVSVQPGGCSGFKYSLVIEDRAADDDLVIPREGFNVFVDPFSAQYLNGVTIDYVTRCKALDSPSRIRIRLAGVAAEAHSLRKASAGQQYNSRAVK